MTAQQIILFTCVYLVALMFAIYFTRATPRRIIGAMAGGGAAGLLGIGAIALCEMLGWWWIPFAATPYFLVLFYVGLAISMMPVYLITWRVARRFGWRGLAVFIGIVMVIGPPRDYLYATMFPNWMVFAPGAAPIVADGATYVGMVMAGHIVMRLVAGPATEDRLARQVGTRC